MKKILCVFGTRPEAIKFAPLITYLRKNSNFKVVICVTGQHREMLDQILTLFDLVPDYDFELMVHNQSLSYLTTQILQSLDPVLEKEKPDCVVVQGDTTSAMAAGLSAFYQQISVVHLEAGLRSYDIFKPWPEEANRRIIGNVSSIHLAPTIKTKQNLVREGVSEENIYVTGNTVIDALQNVKAKIDNEPALKTELQARFSYLKKPFVLLTGHRRETIGEQQKNTFEAIAELADQHDIQVIYPVHLNPKVKMVANQVLANTEKVFLIEPVDYLAMVYLLSECLFVITDSGGIQEEAPSFGKPVLVTREVTERMEGVEAGTALLVGASKAKISQEAKRLILDKEHYQSMSLAVNPYGDGHASERIYGLLKAQYQEDQLETVDG